MKIFRYLVSNKKRKVLLRAFHFWQLRPAKIPPLSETLNTCSSCGTSFQGNFCPRCGQSAKVGRFSLRKTILLFLDEWGLGNRNLLFRCLRDLMLRPGYMIRDYLSGMQSAYFSPFKLFFLLTAFSLIVEQGLKLDIDQPEEQRVESQSRLDFPEPQESKSIALPNGQLEKTNTEIAENTEEVEGAVKAEVLDEKKDEEGNISQPTINGRDETSDAVSIFKNAEKCARLLRALMDKNPALFALLVLVVFSSPMFLFFRSSPNIPNLKFSEFIVALTYTADVFSIYSLVGDLLKLEFFAIIALLMIFVALKQLFGFKKRRLLWYIILTSVISSALLILLIAGVVFIVYRLT